MCYNRSMKVTYQYRIYPPIQQDFLLNRWLDMLRHQYNWLLAERFDWWEQNRTAVNSCPLICHLPELKNQPSRWSQCAGLVILKKEREWYKEVNAQVLQDMVKRVDLAFARYLKGDCNGNRSGKPRFKGQGRYRSFTYPQASIDWIDGNYIELSKIGRVKVRWHRDIPAGFAVKTVTVTKKADGWYIGLSLQDDLEVKVSGGSFPQHTSPVPVASPDLPTMNNTIGIDVGLKSFLTTNEAEEVAIPQFFRKSQVKLAKAQRALARKKKGSNRRKKAVKRVALLHLKVARQRKDFHYKTASKLLSKGMNIGHESLNIKGLAKSRLAKSVTDAGWGQFLDILSIKAENAGLRAIAVNPNGTSQNCSSCGVKVPKDLSVRWHNCQCGCSLDRDHNAAINIQLRAVGQTVQALRGDRDTEPLTREACALSVLR